MKTIPFTFFVLYLLLFMLIGFGFGQPRILDLERNQEITFAELIANVEKTRVIFMGELHDHPGHHQAQLAVIQALHDAGQEVTIGLEMFQRDDQEILDQWVEGKISREELVEAYHRNWQWWPLYQPIFESARDKGHQLLALNVPREITAQVAREGFDSLTPEQMQEIGFVTCRVDPDYEQFIRRTLSAHGHHDFDFQHFCEAQLVWDTAMAQRLGQYLDEHPQATVVVLAGSGHAWRYGIPSQLGLPSDEYAVLLPEIAGRTERAETASEVADYLWLETGPAGWQP
jgi:uncharacterized iron-regulated protein